MAKKPFVLCLMDGMGIEDAKSYNLYDSTVMPNLDAFTNRYFFSTLSSSGVGVGLSENACCDKNIGYLNIGAGCIVKQSIEIVNAKLNENKLFDNEALGSVTSHVLNNQCKLHLITLIGDKYGNDSLVHLRKMIDYCLSIGIKNICIHLFLGANNNSLDKSFPKYTSIVHRLLNLYPSVKLSIIAGVKHLKDSSGITVTKELYKTTVAGIGEHWINYNNAVDSNYKRNNLEENIVPFIVNEGCLIGNTDGVFVFNYENDLASVYTDLLVQPNKYMYTNNTGINIKVASLFPLNNQTSVSCFRYESVKTSFYDCLNRKGAKHLLISDESNISYLNYYFNGCNNFQATQVIGISKQVSDNYDNDISLLHNNITLKALEAIRSNFYDLIIVDYSIVDGNRYRNTDNIKNSLSSLDNCLGQLYKTVIGLNGTLYLSSSYGINEVLYNNKDELVNVNFSQKVPFVIIDNDCSKDNYTLLSGNLSDLSVTILNNLDVPVMELMTGKNLFLNRKKTLSNKKKNKSLLLVLLVFVVLIVIVFVCYYFGLI